MFTGIVEEVGVVEAFSAHEAGARLSVACHVVLSDLSLGGSIAVNGVCLTAIEIRTDGFSADLAPETLERSNLRDLRVAQPVNLERPVTMQTRLSGHIMQGHVDGTGVLESLQDLGEGNYGLSVRVPPQLERYLVYKGSVALDGISLTIASIEQTLLRVAIIPHTFQGTNLCAREAGDSINIECDVLAKHVEKLMRYAAMDSTSASTSDPIFSGVKSDV